MKTTIVMSKYPATVNALLQFSNMYENAKTDAMKADILTAAAVTVCAFDSFKQCAGKAQFNPLSSFPASVARFVESANTTTGDPMTDERNEKDAMTSVISAIISESEKFWNTVYKVNNTVTAVFRHFYRDNGASDTEFPLVILLH